MRFAASVALRSASASHSAFHISDQANTGHTAALAAALEDGPHNEAVAKFTLPPGEARRVQPMHFVPVPLRPQDYFGGVLKLVRHYGSGGFHAGEFLA